MRCSCCNIQLPSPCLALFKPEASYFMAHRSEFKPEFKPKLHASCHITQNWDSLMAWHAWLPVRPMRPAKSSGCSMTGATNRIQSSSNSTVLFQTFSVARACSVVALVTHASVHIAKQAKASSVAKVPASCGACSATAATAAAAACLHTLPTPHALHCASTSHPPWLLLLLLPLLLRSNAVGMQACMHACTCMYVCMHACMYMCVCARVCVCVCVYTGCRSIIAVRHVGTGHVVATRVGAGTPQECGM